VYLQITTRCNMSCAHCAMCATVHGTDMSREVFDAALAWTEEIGDIVSLGGGEPTLHPLFEDFLWECIRYGVDEEQAPFVATNGSITQTALRLALLARKGLVSAALSQDEYHDNIDCSVIDAFTLRGPRREDDYREIRTVRRILNTGRARDNAIADAEGCVCPGWCVRPNGDITPCGCIDAPVLTNVLNRDTAVLADWEDCVQEGSAHKRWEYPIGGKIELTRWQQ